MIYIGATGWSDHNSLYATKKDQLPDYAAHFPTVEVDTSFYHIPPKRNAKKWVAETPKIFQFIVKAYQGMTGHLRGESPYDNKQEMFTAFKEALGPIIDANKLAMVLFQFPPWFTCTRENVEYLRWCKREMGDIPCALEFRHQSWFMPAYRKRTLDFMRAEKWIHCICDEPQSGEGSVPTVLETTDAHKVLVRFHGRNVYGWQKRNDENWREVRYLYRYNHEELMEWSRQIEQLATHCEHVYLLFNNNSGGDAADNAKQIMKLLNLDYQGLAPRQLDLF